MRGRLSMAVGRSTFGAERRHVTLPTDFRSRSVNGHSRYGQWTARFAPEPSFAITPLNRRSGWEAALPRMDGPRGNARRATPRCSSSRAIVACRFDVRPTRALPRSAAVQ